MTRHYDKLRVEVGDQVRAWEEAQDGAIVTSRRDEQAWRTGTVVETLAPAPPAFDYTAAISADDILARLADQRAAWASSNGLRDATTERRITREG